MLLICFHFISEISVSTVVVVAGFAKSRLRSKEATTECRKSREAFSKLFFKNECYYLNSRSAVEVTDTYFMSEVTDHFRTQ